LIAVITGDIFLIAVITGDIFLMGVITGVIVSTGVITGVISLGVPPVGWTVALGLVVGP
jgi:hypothetical protein